MGTRMSARLSGMAQGDEEWQEIPDEWLNERREAEEDDGASGSERLDGEAEMGQSCDSDLRPEPEPEAVPDPDTDAHRAKTGLESDDDDVSELTELTEISPPATVFVSHSNTKKAPKKSAGNRRKTSRTKRGTLVVENSVDIAQSVEPEEDIEPEWRPPEDFVEWETVRFFSPGFVDGFDDSMDMQLCVTLNDWEHICERFEGATHYAEKALYKLLSQHIVPAIVAELRVSPSLSTLRHRFEQKPYRRYNGSGISRKQFHNANAPRVSLLKKAKRKKHGWLRSRKLRKRRSSAARGD